MATPVRCIDVCDMRVIGNFGLTLACRCPGGRCGQHNPRGGRWSGGGVLLGMSASTGVWVVLTSRASGAVVSVGVQGARCSCALGYICGSISTKFAAACFTCVGFSRLGAPTVEVLQW